MKLRIGALALAPAHLPSCQGPQRASGRLQILGRRLGSAALAQPAGCRSRVVRRANTSSEKETTQLEPMAAPARDLEKGDVKAETLRGDLRQLALWVTGAVLFGGGVWYTMGGAKGQEYFAGYLLEQSLSIDNLFVFVLVFNYFKTPPDAQKKVLSWGIYSAAALRLVMILAGTTLIEKFRPLLLVFAGILVYSAYGLLTGSQDEDDDLSDNTVVKYCRKLIPCTDTYDGDRFITQVNGVRRFTPLLLVLAVIEISDVIFAVDSIPAVFGVTLDPFIIYTSNIFAILSLRSLYTFVADVMDGLHLLDKSIALVLGFIGVKLVLEFLGYDIPTSVSLGVVASLLGGGVALSYVIPTGDAKQSSDSK